MEPKKSSNQANNNVEPPWTLSNWMSWVLPILSPLIPIFFSLLLFGSCVFRLVSQFILRGDNMLAALAFGASLASASTLPVFGESFSLPQHSGSLSLGWLRPEPAPSGTGAVHSAHGPAQVLGGRGLCGPCTWSAGWCHWPRAVRGLAPGPAAAESVLGPPAVPACWHFSPGLSCLPAGQGSGPAAHHARAFPPLLRAPAQPEPHRLACPCSMAPGPIRHPKAEECRHGKGLVGSSAGGPSLGSTR